MGDVTHIYNMSGKLCAKYVYDAWGNHQIETNENNIATINPIRYRGYYYDTETELYYLQTRYYDPETGRFISQDDISYLAPENLTGLNLYAYCHNNPVNYADPSGHAPEWWQWALFGIGVALVAVAAGMAIIGTGGVAAFGMGALIGSAAVGGAGAVVGGVIGYATGGVEGILGGALAGFGIGAIVGFVIGGTIGGIHHQQVANYISQYARNADDATEIYQSFSGKIRLKTSNGRVNAYRYYDNVNAFQRGRYLTNATTNNPIKDLVLYKNNATMLAKFNLPKGTQYLVGKIAGSPVNAIQYFVGDPTKLILLV